MSASSTRAARRKNQAAATLEWAGWYAVTREGFWAAWWTGEPTSSPWRTPDATGHAQDSTEAAIGAERATRAVKGPSAYVRQMDASYAVAAQREAAGAQPNHQPPAQPRVKGIYYTSRPLPGDRTHRARLYWTARDLFARFGLGDPDPRKYGFRKAPERPADMPPPDPRASGSWAPNAYQDAAPPSAFRELGLKPGASAEEIRRAYRRLVSERRLHPDQGGSVAAFREITSARDLALAHAGRAVQ